MFHRARFVAAILLLSVPVACRSTPRYSTPRYTVTATPISLIGPGHPGHCIAIDPTDPQGVWTWEPAPSGCAKRSSDVRRPDRAKVTTIPSSGAVEVHFQIQLQVGGPLEVGLTLQDAVLGSMALGAQVATEYRSDLNVPDLAGQVR